MMLEIPGGGEVAETASCTASECFSRAATHIV